jgi:hypothetical protein
MRRSLIALLVVLALPAWAADTIRWDEAEKYDGQQVTVDGYVMDVVCGSQRCTMAFDPTSRRFAVVVKANRFNVFPPADLAKVYTGQHVHAHGTIRLVDGRPEMAVRNADDLELVRNTKEVVEQKATEERQERAVQHDEVVGRLDEVLDHVDQLGERIGELEQRLDVLLAALDQQSQTLAAIEAGPPPPAPPTYGQPQPRPGWEKLRSLKRGMTTAEVQRLVGAPLTVQQSGNGWVIWDYGYGRSISFNERGRVASLVGFPKP